MESPESGSSSASPRIASTPRSWEPPPADRLAELLPAYEVLRLIGRGGMGAVYEALQKSLRRKVAIKILPRGAGDDELHFAERFRHEAFAMARLSHPGIVNVFDAGETPDGLLFFVMELVEGRDLAHELETRGPLPETETLSIVTQVAEALAYAHGNGIVHRDIKPANLLLDARGRVKVADFGLARLEEAERSWLLTRTGTTMGTPDYIAPELRKAGRVADARADLFSLGVMAYQMLTGELPRGMFKLPSECVPGLDERWDRFVCRALEPKPEDRYQSAGEILHDLVGDDPTEEGKSVTRGPVRKVVLAATVVMLPLGIFIGMFSQKPSPQSGQAFAEKTGLPVAASPPGNTIDLMPLIDVTRDAVAGEWRLDGGRLVVSPSGEIPSQVFPRLELPYAPSGEYDFEVEFEVAGDGSGVYQILSAQDRSFSWTAGVKLAAGFKAGFDRIEGKSVMDRPDGSVMRPSDFLKAGRRHVLKVEVRGTTLRGFLDGEPLVHWGTTAESFQLLDLSPRLTLRDPNRLGLAADNRAVTFHRVVVREVTAPGDRR